MAITPSKVFNQLEAFQQFFSTKFRGVSTFFFLITFFRENLEAFRPFPFFFSFTAKAKKNSNSKFKSNFTIFQNSANHYGELWEAQIMSSISKDKAIYSER